VFRKAVLVICLFYLTLFLHPAYSDNSAFESGASWKEVKLERNSRIKLLARDSSKSRLVVYSQIGVDLDEDQALVADPGELYLENGDWLLQNDSMFYEIPDNKISYNHTFIATAGTVVEVDPKSDGNKLPVRKRTRVIHESNGVEAKLSKDLYLVPVPKRDNISRLITPALLISRAGRAITVELDLHGVNAQDILSDQFQTCFTYASGGDGSQTHVTTYSRTVSSTNGKAILEIYLPKEINT